MKRQLSAIALAAVAALALGACGSSSKKGASTSNSPLTLGSLTTVPQGTGQTGGGGGGGNSGGGGSHATNPTTAPQTTTTTAPVSPHFKSVSADTLTVPCDKGSTYPVAFSWVAVGTDNVTVESPNMSRLVTGLPTTDNYPDIYDCTKTEATWNFTVSTGDGNGGETKSITIKKTAP